MNKPEFRNDYSHILMQKNVREDIYMVMLNLGLYPQTPDCVAITTKNGMHTICSYPYDDKRDHWGGFEHSLSVAINVNYEFEELEKIIKEKIMKNKLGRRERVLDDWIKPYINSINERFKKC